MIRTGLILNPRSRRNLESGAHAATAEDVLAATPRSHAELDEALAWLAASRIELLVIDGGDGTVRDVLTQAPAHFREGLPRLAVLPSGKTNALALDLDAPAGWSLAAAQASAAQGRFATRRPLEVFRDGGASPVARGFIFGAGAFVRATDLAQRTHEAGAFEGLAIGLTLGAATLQTLAGAGGWRRGEKMRLAFQGEAAGETSIFLLLASTLERLPLGLKPFGPPREGLKSLTVDAPPKRLSLALPPLLSGGEAKWLEAAGYHRRANQDFEVALKTRFILDGEAYPGGELSVRAGPALEFVTP